MKQDIMKQVITVKIPTDRNSQVRYLQIYTLQHAATRCNTLQHAATRCSTLQHAATRCNTLQHAATRCNTLQHAVARYNTQSTHLHIGISV